MKYNRVDMKHLFPSLQIIIGGRSDWIIQYLCLMVDCNVRKCLASTWAQMLQTYACIRVCASDVSFIHLSLCPRGQSPTQRETMKSMTLESKAKWNIHLYMFRKETQTILWQIYTCMQEWDSCDMPGQLLRVCVCIHKKFSETVSVPAGGHSVVVSMSTTKFLLSTIERFSSPFLSPLLNQQDLPSPNVHWQGNSHRPRGLICSLMFHWTSPLSKKMWLIISSWSYYSSFYGPKAAWLAGG